MRAQPLIPFMLCYLYPDLRYSVAHGPVSWRGSLRAHEKISDSYCQGLPNRLYSLTISVCCAGF